MRMILDSRQDHLIFQIFNQHEKISLEEIGHFFEIWIHDEEQKRGDRGLGLYRAKMIAEKAGGEITVGQEEIGGRELYSVCRSNLEVTRVAFPA